jgi:hypothetical protein
MVTIVDYSLRTNKEEGILSHILQAGIQMLNSKVPERYYVTINKYAILMLSF